MVLSEPALVGREHELKELQMVLNSSIEGKGTTVFVSGEAGSGKTRLTNEFLKLARKKGVLILSGWCLSNAAVPYFPFVEAFESYLSENEEESSRSMGSQQLGLKTWLMGRNQAGGLQNQGAMSPQVWKDQMFAAVTKELLFMSTDKPLVLFIDDLHWADSASLSLLHYIARAIGTERILILATFRSEEVSSNAEGFVHPLLDTLRLMGREDLFKEVKLLNLNQPDVGRIAENMLGGKVGPELVEKIAEESRGNPLFVIESLRMLFENGSFVQQDDEWRLVIDKLGIPTKVKDIILRRLSALKPNQRRTLDVASVIGDKFDPQLIGAVLNQDSLEILETLNTVALSKSLVCVEGDYYRFDHAKSREVLYDEILLPLKKGYHERVAEKIEGASEKTKRVLVSDLAYHYIHAGNKEKSVEYALLTGKDALSRFSNSEAIKYFTYVIQTVGEDPDHVEEKASALEGLGDAYHASMMFKEAAKTFEALANVGGVVRLRALRKAMEAAFFQNDIPLLAELIKEAEKCDVTDRLENARILLNKGRVFVMQGRQALATEYFEEALRVFEAEYSVWDTAWDLIALGSNAPTTGQLEKSLSAVVRSIALFRELGDSRWLIEAYNMAGLTYVAYFGFWKEGMDMFEKAAQVNENAKIGDYLRLAQLNAQWAWVHSSMGDLQGALSKSLKALDYSDKTDSDWAKGMAYANLTMYYTMIEDLKHAEEYFGKLMKLPPEVLLNPNLNAPLTTAVFLAGKNQWEESMQVFNAMFAHFKANPNPGGEAMVKMTYAWALGRQGHGVEAMAQVQEAQKFYQDIAKRFEHVNVQASLMAPIRVAGDQTFEARLDLVNVSRTHGLLVRVENIVPSEFKVINSSPECHVKNGAIELKESKLEPFGVLSIKLTLQATKAGVFGLNPKAVYLDDLGQTKTSKPKPITITVASAPTKITEAVAEPKIAKLEFKSEASQKAFDFLISSFKEDYFRHRLPQERSGWRTKMDIIKQGRVSKYSVYGSSSSPGQAITELQRNGLVEARMFIGERGRGGKTYKVRIAYEQEIIKRHIAQKSE